MARLAIELMDNRKDGNAHGNLDSLLGLLKLFIWVLYLIPMKDPEMISLMIYCVGSCKYGTAYEKNGGLLDRI